MIKAAIYNLYFKVETFFSVQDLIPGDNLEVKVRSTVSFSLCFCFMLLLLLLLLLLLCATLPTM